MKKFGTGVLLTIIIIAIIIATVVITKKTVDNPVSQKPETVIEKIFKADGVTITPDPTTLIKEIKKLKRLETATLLISEEFNATRDNERLWGILGEEMTFIANGQVVAGIDFSSFDENDFRLISEGIIEITIPEAQIFNVIIDNDTSYVTSRTKGIFAKFDTQLETEVRIYAQDEFEKIAKDSYLSYQATMNAVDYLQDFIQGLGYTTVVFKIDG